MRTFKVLRSTDFGFTFAVRDVLPRMKFNPAELRGAKVRQMVQQPFTFALTPF
jgi:protein TonB